MSSSIITLHRQPSKDEGTFGRMKLPNGQELMTLECPWLDNRRRVSCIPTGTYEVLPHVSKKFGKCFWVQDVPGRSEILFHVGNWAGNSEKGYRTDSLGCILVGTSTAFIKGQLGISNSRHAMDVFLKTVTEPFTLQIGD